MVANPHNARMTSLGVRVLVAALYRRTDVPETPAA